MHPTVGVWRQAWPYRFGEHKPANKRGGGVSAVWRQQVRQVVVGGVSLVWGGGGGGLPWRRSFAQACMMHMDSNMRRYALGTSVVHAFLAAVHWIAIIFIL